MNGAIQWLVIGAGRAGRIRARDIEAEPGHELYAQIPGRTSTDAIHTAIATAPIDAVAICVENARHEALANAALDAGRHTLVEFPLCFTAAGALGLTQLAQRSGLTLHLELIGLLTGGHLALREHVGKVGLSTLQVDFSGGLYGWVAEEAAADRWGQLCVGRLHALWDIAGPLTLDTVALTTPKSGGYRLTAHLRGARGEPIVLTEQRGPDLKRSASWSGEDGAGIPISRARLQPSVPLFLQDLRRCAARIGGDASAAYVSDEDVIAVAGLAEQISLLAARSL